MDTSDESDNGAVVTPRIRKKSTTSIERQLRKKLKKSEDEIRALKCQLETKNLLLSSSDQPEGSTDEPNSCNSNSVRENVQDNFRAVRSSTMRESRNGNESLMVSTVGNISLGTMTIPECKPPNEDTEINKQSYEDWKGMLEASLSLMGEPDERTKMCIFRIRAGPKLLEIFNTTVSCQGMADENSHPFTNAIARLDNYFGSKTYMLIQRSKLLNMVQKEQEDNLQYVRRVIAAVKLCGYNDSEELEAIVRTITKGTVDSRVRVLVQRSWINQRSLNELIESIRQNHIEKLNEEEFRKTLGQNQNASIAAVSSGRTRPKFYQNEQSQYRFSSRPYIHNTFPPNRFAANQQYMQSWNRQPWNPRFQNPWHQQYRYPQSWNQQSQNPRNQRTWKPQIRSQIDNGSTSYGNFRGPVKCWRCDSHYHGPDLCKLLLNGVVCKGCSEKGHILRTCPSQKGVNPPSRQIAAVQELDDETEDADNKVLTSNTE
ncbi:uncharacterized protein LOC129751574 [Uranotaenia lowii]|uniref:uncharacterized protein LOC129751574 n=1 Tax=Uranotaenia lowii TaxID=190385 RepID=UPI00247852DC|nr:uncharacterized protein LOC129751574 [Uranotaenia lowii]